MSALKDLINKQFGRLKVIERIGSNKYKVATWRCVCEPSYGGCGKEKIATSSSLINGKTKSCGCLHKDSAKVAATKISRNRKGAEHPSWKGGRITTKAGYVYIKAPDNHPRANNAGYILEHIIVMENTLGRYLVEGENVHHINGVRGDNRPSNLEIWNTTQPAGQRPEDKVAYAIEIVRLYAPDKLSEFVKIQ